MSMILANKTHIIYGVLIILIGSIAYHFFKKDPEKITTTPTKVVTQLQTVEKVVTKDKVVYVDRVIVTTDHKKNGDVIVTKEVDHQHSDTQLAAKTDSQTHTQSTEQKQVVESFMKNYSVEGLFPVNPFNPLLPNPLDTQVNFGMRVFDLPVFAVVGTNGHLNQLMVGLRVEF